MWLLLLLMVLQLRVVRLLLLLLPLRRTLLPALSSSGLLVRGHLLRRLQLQLAEQRRPPELGLGRVTLRH